MRDKATLTVAEREALRLLGEYTRGQYDVYRLSGNICGNLRANIAGALTEKKVPVKNAGVTEKKVPVKNAGVTALRDAFWKMAEVPSACSAVQNQSFIDWAKRSKRRA